tara:strand:+ start:42367 stop:43476 length:1110 start_codon:yes stop_codon:yes gene_type:complete
MYRSKYNAAPSEYNNNNKNSSQKSPFYCKILSVFGKVSDKIINLLDKLYTTLKLTERMSLFSAGTNIFGIFYLFIVLLIVIWPFIKWIINFIMGLFGSSFNSNIWLGPPQIWFYFIVLQKIILGIFLFLVVFSKIKNLKGRVSGGSDSLVNLILAALESGSLLCHLIGAFIALGFVISIFLYVCQTRNSSDIDLASTYFPLEQIMVITSLVLLLIIILIQYLSFKADICKDPKFANKSFLQTINGTAKTFFILALIFIMFKIFESMISKLVTSSALGVFKLVGGPDYTIPNDSCLNTQSQDEDFSFFSFLKSIGEIGLFILFVVILFIQSPLGIVFNTEKISNSVCNVISKLTEKLTVAISPPTAVRKI